MQFWYFLAINSKIENELETLSCQHHYLPAWLCIDAYDTEPCKRHKTQKECFWHSFLFSFPSFDLSEGRSPGCWDDYKIKRGWSVSQIDHHRSNLWPGNCPDFTQDLSQRCLTFPQTFDHIWLILTCFSRYLICGIFAAAAIPFCVTLLTR